MSIAGCAVAKKFAKHLKKAEEHEHSTPLPLRPPASRPEDFPVEALGKTLAGAVKAIVDKVQCPEAIAVQSVLAATSLATQAHADVVHPATGDRRPLSLALVTVAASGERKSAADSIALEPVRLREAELHQAFERDKLDFLNEKEAYDKVRKSALNRPQGERKK